MARERSQRQYDTGDAEASGWIAGALASAAEQPMLAPRESDVYRLLLVAPGLTAAEIAGRAGHSVASSRAALARLSGSGLVRADGKRPRRYVANPPAAALGGYLHRLEGTLDRHRRLIAGLDELYSIGRSKHAHRVMEVVTGKQGIARRFMHLESGVRSEIMVFDRPPYVLQPGDPRQEAAELTLLARGVRVRCVYDRQGLDSPHALEQMTALSRAGEQARLATGLPVKLAIFDRAAAVLPIGPGSGEDQIMIIRPSALLSILIQYFERIWGDAAPLLVPAIDDVRPAAARSPVTPPARGRAGD
ncbi:MAG: TrmB family transcriptional regulator, partial [Streptosporangiaceae bacterium]